MTARTPLPRLRMLLVLLAVTACQRAAEAPAPREPRVVGVVPVQAGPAQPPLHLPGVLEARAETRLAFAAGGVITQLAVREGQAVRRGQVLAQIDDADAAAASAQALATLQQAQRDAARGRHLLEQDVIARERYETLQTAERVAQAQWDRAQAQHGRTRLLAPADGVVLARLAEPQEVVAPGQPVLRVRARGEPAVLQVQVPDREFLRLRVGDVAQVSFAAWPQREFSAAVVQRAAAADPRTGTFSVKLQLESAAAELPLGLMGRVTLAGSGAATRPRVPLAALVDGQGEHAAVYRLEGGRVRRVAVRVAYLDGDQAALATDLAVGSLVVSQGADLLEDGDAVRLRRRD